MKREKIGYAGNDITGKRHNQAIHRKKQPFRRKSKTIFVNTLHLCIRKQYETLQPKNPKKTKNSIFKRKTNPKILKKPKNPVISKKPKKQLSKEKLKPKRKQLSEKILSEKTITTFKM